jgi:hypothetical protein
VRSASPSSRGGWGPAAGGEEHDGHAWLTRAAARRRYHWPREREMLDHIAVLFKGGNAGKAEDVLRITKRCTGTCAARAARSKRRAVAALVA